MSKENYVISVFVRMKVEPVFHCRSASEEVLNLASPEPTSTSVSIDDDGPERIKILRNLRRECYSIRMHIPYGVIDGIINTLQLKQVEDDLVGNFSMTLHSYRCFFNLSYGLPELDRSIQWPIFMKALWCCYSDMQARRSRLRNQGSAYWLAVRLMLN